MMSNEKKITGIILAGGQSSRMGTDKGLLHYQGKELVAHVFQNISAVTESNLIVSGNPVYKKFGVPVIADIHPGCGPLGGIHTGLMFSKTEWNLVIGCDMPFITKAFLEFLLSKSRFSKVTVPVHDGETEPICAIYPRSALPKIESLLLQGELKMQRVVGLMEADLLEVPKEKFNPGLIFRNFNTPQDIASAN